MDNISVREAAEKWGISMRRVQILCDGGRIPGAARFGRTWLIPADAKKPANPQQDKSAERQYFLTALIAHVAAVTVPMPKDDPDSILSTISDERVRRHYEAELAYLRGDFHTPLQCYEQTRGDDIARICIGPLAIPAAAALAQYDTYLKIEKYYKTRIKNAPEDAITCFEEICLASAAISAKAPELIPAWVAAGDFSGIPPALLPDALYLRAMYLYYCERYDATLVMLETALAIYSPDRVGNNITIYVRLLRAASHYALGHTAEAERLLLEAMHLYLPHRFITPFIEMIAHFGGMMKKCVLQAYPEHYDAFTAQKQWMYKNWRSFYNRFTTENVTGILTADEFRIAQMAARRVSYANIAKQVALPAAEVKEMLQTICQKLSIADKSKLNKLVLTRKSWRG